MATRLHPATRDLYALALVSADRHDEARSRLGAWSEQPPLPWDYLWLTGTVLRALIWSQLGDQAAIAELRGQLEPFTDRVADGAMAACFFGSVQHALAVLALAAGDLDAVRMYAQAAVAMHDSLGWPRWAELSREVLRDTKYSRS